MACERTWCPGMTATSRVACSGKGRCLSMKEAAALYQYPNSVNTYTYTSTWDADKIFGCICDDGYTDDCGSCNADCSAAGSGSTCGDGNVCPEFEE